MRADAARDHTHVRGQRSVYWLPLLNEIAALDEDAADQADSAVQGGHSLPRNWVEVAALQSELPGPGWRMHVGANGWLRLVRSASGTLPVVRTEAP